MKKLFIVILFSFYSHSIAQVDSILKNIKNEPDTTKIRILNDLCWKNRSSDPRVSLQYGLEALKIGHQIDSKIHQALSSNYIGVVYRNLGEYNQALRYYFDALKLSKEVADSEQVAYSYNNIGGIYRLTGDYESALTNIFNALGIFDRLKDKTGTAFCTINIAIIYRKEKNYPKAIEYLNYTLKIREELGDEQGRALTLNQLAEVYFEEKDYEKAKNQYLILKGLYEKIGEKKGVAAVWGGLGGIYQIKGDIQKALYYRNKALALNKEIGNIEGQIFNLNALGILEVQNHRNELALKYLEEALALSVIIKSDISRLDCYKFFGEYFNRIPNYAKAYEYSQRYIQLKDSILSRSQIELSAELDARYKIEKAHRQNELLQKDIEVGYKQRTYLLIIVVLVIFVVVVLYLRYRAKKIANRNLEHLNAMKDKFFKILAHDLKNPFHSLLGFSEYLNDNYDDIDDADIKSGILEMHNSSKNLYELVENLLDWSRAQTESIEVNPERINVTELIDKNLLVFEQSAKFKKIGFVKNINENLHVFADKNMLNTIIRNLISNAIKFSYPESEINISAESSGGKILIHIKDNGVGIPPEKVEGLFEIDRSNRTLGTNKEKGSGLGLMLVKELIKISNGEIFVKSEPEKGSTFTISIPADN